MRIPHSYYQVDFVIGSAIEPFGPAGSNIFYSAQNRLVSYDNAAPSRTGHRCRFAVRLRLSRCQQQRRVRRRRAADCRCQRDRHRSAQTTQIGRHRPVRPLQFDNLPAGTYTITETQPGGYTDGSDTLGTQRRQREQRQVFEHHPAGACRRRTTTLASSRRSAPRVAGNQTQTIAFWNGTSGQNLIKALNGSQNAKNLGNWLATNFGNLFGSAAGTANNLSGKTNAQVAAYFQSLYANAAKKAEAEALALALTVYVTNSNLAGHGRNVVRLRRFDDRAGRRHGQRRRQRRGVRH